MNPDPSTDTLERFVTAQDPVYAAVEAELRAGRKRTHWMWFVFPQMRGLGSSAMAHTYGIESLAGASAYLAHPLLGDRLRACTSVVLAARGRSIHEIFGSPDDMKFHSSMTLFSLAETKADNIFSHALQRHFNGRPDAATLALLHDR